MTIDLHPRRCNICGGEVIFTSNAKIYGREYGSGKCYLCTRCGAYVGTHEPRPTEALGILADEKMRALKMEAHDLFDQLWLNKKDRRSARQQAYAWLADQMGISREMCHFGYFDNAQLKTAISILKEVLNETDII